MNLLDAPVREVAWAAIDFEGTGSAPGQSDEAVQVGVAVMPVDFGPPGNFFRSFVRPEGRLTHAASAVHRITDRDVRDAPPLPVLWPEIRARLAGAVVVAHGAGTERRFLRAFPMHGFGPWVDTLALSRALRPDLPDHALAAVVAANGLERDVREACPQHDWHDALFDAVACLAVLRHLVARCGLESAAVGQLASPDAAVYYRDRKMKRLALEAGLDPGGQGPA